jgi:hypothetical protein
LEGRLTCDNLLGKNWRTVSVLRLLREWLSRPYVSFAVATIFAFLVTWLTGFIPILYGAPSGVLSQYGLPLVWRMHFDYPGHLGPPGLLIPAFHLTTYSWDAFCVDALLYMGIAYSVVLWIRKYYGLFWGLAIAASAAWLAFASAWPFPSWSQIQWGTPANGLPFPWMGIAPFTGAGSYNWIGLGADAILFAALEYFAFFVYRGFRVIHVSSPATIANESF